MYWLCYVFKDFILKHQVKKVLDHVLMVLLGFCVCFQTLVFNKTLNSSLKELQFLPDLSQALFPQQGPWGKEVI